MFNKVLGKAAALLVLAIGATVARAQDQANLAASTASALAAKPGFAYNAELNVLPTKVIWEFRVFGTDGKAYKISVNAPTATVLKAKKASINKNQPTSADVDLLEAVQATIDAIADKYDDDAQVLEVSLKTNKKKGNYWQVGLKSTTTDGLWYEAKIDAKTGAVLKLESSTDGDDD